MLPISFIDGDEVTMRAATTAATPSITQAMTFVKLPASVAVDDQHSRSHGNEPCRYQPVPTVIHLPHAHRS
ncbi:MAG: hypothetical protein H7123_08280 [Thermoleophilia bacterium]|nr:hypothetical protein [Thermoleophilia bacterium]